MDPGRASVGELAARASRCLGFGSGALITDLDGTISPIVADPATAAVLPPCRVALAALARHLDLVAVLTGRKSHEARSMVEVPGIEIFGAHGLTHWTPRGEHVEPDLAPFVGALAEAAPRVRQLGSLRGVVVEEKGLALAVHYRQAPRPEVARQSVVSALEPIAAQLGLAVSEGRKVVELRPPAPYGKGWRVARLAAERRLQSLVYIGDDTTDLDAFRALQMWREGAPNRFGLAIAVASREAPPKLLDMADGVLPDVPAVALFLSELARALAQRRQV